MNLSCVPCQADTDEYLKLTVNDYLQVMTKPADEGDPMVFHAEGRIIDRADLLGPETVPARITGRIEQIEKLCNCLKPMETASAPTSARLYGPPGAGKTAIARKTAEGTCNTQGRISLYVNC